MRKTTHWWSRWATKTISDLLKTRLAAPPARKDLTRKMQPTGSTRKKRVWGPSRKAALLSPNPNQIQNMIPRHNIWMNKALTAQSKTLWWPNKLNLSTMLHMAPSLWTTQFKHTTRTRCRTTQQVQIILTTTLRWWGLAIQSSLTSKRNSNLNNLV